MMDRSFANYDARMDLDYVKVRRGQWVEMCPRHIFNALSPERQQAIRVS
jgi:hypothetical protein